MALKRLEPRDALEAVLFFHLTGSHDSISYWDETDVELNRELVADYIRRSWGWDDEDEIQEYVKPGFWYSDMEGWERCGSTSAHVAAWCLDYFDDRVGEVVEELLASESRCRYMYYDVREELRTLWRIHELKRGLYCSKSRPRDRRRIEALKKKARRLVAERRFEQERPLGPHAQKLRMEIEGAYA